MDLGDLIHRYLTPLLKKYGNTFSDEQRSALWAICNCRTSSLGNVVYKCEKCDSVHHVPHSCGHRSCPRCHHHSTVQWMQRQQSKLIPARYYLITFTVPSELRPVIFGNQKLVYNAMFKAVEQTIVDISSNKRHLGALPGFTAVLHTHSRRLDYHPHIHVVIPAGGIDVKKKMWVAKSKKHLFPCDVLKALFRGKLLSRLKQSKIYFNTCVYNKKWAVNIQAAGTGEPALKYLSVYLNKGVIQKRNIVSDIDGVVTFRYFDSKDRHWRTRSMPAVEFLHLVLVHTLPKAFRRVRDFGFHHGNAKETLYQIQLMLKAAPSIFEQPKRTLPKCNFCQKPLIILACKVFPDRKQTRGPP